MALSGPAHYATLAFLFAWLLAMIWVTGQSWHRLTKEPHAPARKWLTASGSLLAAVAVLSLIVLHVSWVSPDVSQHAGVQLVKIVGSLLLFPSLIGFVLNLFGTGRIRFLGIASTLASAAWWFVLAIDSGISMGTPLARHPTKFLVPDRYAGWIEIRYGVAGAPSLPIDHGTRICSIPADAILLTSSSIENGWAEDEYDYHMPDGTNRRIRETIWGGGGLVWGGQVVQPLGADSSEFRRDEFIYIGTEDAFKRGESKNGLHPPG